MIRNADPDAASIVAFRLGHEMRTLVTRLSSLHHTRDELTDGVALLDEAALRMATARALAEYREATLCNLLDRDLIA